jgi:SAM-dependent methyltransferase
VEAVSAAQEVERQCPLCAAPNAHALPHYSLGHWRVVRCGACGFVYLRNAPVYDRLRSELAWEKSFESHARRVKKTYPLLTWLDTATRWRLHIARPSETALYLKVFKQGRVLDLGCGSGSKIPAPLIPFGVEISEALAAQAHAAMQARGGACICAPALEGLASFADGYFSGVMLRSFLEHEIQPAALLRETARVLAPGGTAYVKVPNYGGLNRRVMGPRWCGFRHPDHVNYFARQSLTAMAEGAGLRLQLLNRFNHPLDDNLHASLHHA